MTYGATSREKLGLAVFILIVVSSAIGIYTFSSQPPHLDQAPDASFSHRYNHSAERVVFIHESGSTLDRTNTDKLLVVVTSETSTRQRPIDLPVREGRRIVVDNVQAGTTVRLVWEEDKKSATYATVDLTTTTAS